MAIGPRVIRNPLILVLLSAMTFMVLGAFCYVGGSSCSKSTRVKQVPVQQVHVIKSHRVATQVAKTAPVVAKTQKGWLGVQIKTVVAQQNRRGSIDGVMIVRVLGQFAANTSGFAQGDIVTHFNGMAMKTAPQLKSRVSAHKPGMRVPVRVIRNGTPVTLYPTLGSAPANMRSCKTKTK